MGVSAGQVDSGAAAKHVGAQVLEERFLRVALAYDEQGSFGMTFAATAAAAAPGHSCGTAPYAPAMYLA
jgi:hypothetical protein